MTKNDIADNVSGNTLVDKMLMGASAAIMLMATFVTALDYVKAERPMNYVLAGGFITMLLFFLLAPMFRK